MSAPCRIAALVLLLAGAARAAAPSPPVVEPLTAGATIVGDDDAAIGLYLTPWQDEEPLPPGRNPSTYTLAPVPADEVADRARIEGLDSIDGYRRARRQSYGN